MEQYSNIIDEVISGLLSDNQHSNKQFTSLRRIASWDTPYVNYAYQDIAIEKTLAVIFCNENNEIDTVKSNTIKALNHFDSVLVCFSSLQLNLSNLFVLSLEDDGLSSLPIGVMAYDNNGVTVILRRITVSQTTAKKRTQKEQKSYWCWWRDSSQYEIALLLRLSKLYDAEDETDIYTKKVYPDFFDMMISGKTKKWDGTPREKSYSPAIYKAEKQNYKIPMCQLGLWYVDSGRITQKGLFLLNVADTYGDDSEEYFNALAKIILVDGKHLELVKDLDEFQKKNPEILPETSSEFFVLFDEYMMHKNSIGTRKPSAVTTGAKKAYVRDEPKLWNKLGIIKMQNSSRYFKPFHGIEFNWDRINEIILSSSFGG